MTLGDVDRAATDWAAQLAVGRARLEGKHEAAQEIQAALDALRAGGPLSPEHARELAFQARAAVIVLGLPRRTLVDRAFGGQVPPAPERAELALAARVLDALADPGARRGL